MTYDDFISFFGNTTNACNALGKSRQVLNLWKQKKEIPIDQQCLIEIATKGRLEADKNLIPQIDFKNSIITPKKKKLKLNAKVGA